QLDPDLDLWVTAKPFLEKWMKEQVGLQGLRQRTEREAERWSAMLPELPRLTHIALKRLAYPEPNATAAMLGQLIEENRRTRRWVVVLSFLVFLLLVNMLALLIKLWGLFLLPPPGG
ncbi:MAG: ubiquinone biosynthesis regulatory protein kinase UbiB, partial [Burkholderiaceae bacterium]|nr:ubiquinone biosynthesis regulatory protein kinase UbiB [Burkholderiaceae bacterium]